LADIWSDVLHVERVSIDDSLFDLGADSINLFQITARANRAGILLTPQHLLVHRTIAALSQELHLDNGVSQEPSGPVIVPVSREKFRKSRSQKVSAPK
jgi:aryl carrier-like protein